MKLFLANEAHYVGDTASDDVANVYDPSGDYSLRGKVGVTGFSHLDSDECEAKTYARKRYISGPLGCCRLFELGW